MVFLFIKAEAMVVRFGTLAPLKTPIKVLTVVVQSASTLLSMDVISGSVQRARRELLYPIILSSSGMEIPAVWAYFTLLRPVNRQKPKLRQILALLLSGLKEDPWNFQNSWNIDESWSPQPGYDFLSMLLCSPPSY